MKIFKSCYSLKNNNYKSTNFNLRKQTALLLASKKKKQTVLDFFFYLNPQPNPQSDRGINKDMNELSFFFFHICWSKTFKFEHPNKQTKLALQV